VTVLISVDVPDLEAAIAFYATALRRSGATGWTAPLFLLRKGAFAFEPSNPDVSTRASSSPHELAPWIVGRDHVAEPVDQLRFELDRTKRLKLDAIMNTIGPLAAALPHAIRPRFVDNNNGLRMHLLEAGFEESGRPCVVLLHGFPELAYSWRKIMMPLAAAFHVIAPDQRGYGRTTGWDPDYDGDLASFRIQNLVKDVLGLAMALGYRSVHAVVSHDFGSPVAAYCALIRPDVFRSVVLMSAPFAGPPALPFDTARPSSSASTSDSDIHADLAALARPRKHYQWYYATRAANDDMLNGAGGVHAFLRAYYHHKRRDTACRGRRCPVREERRRLLQGHQLSQEAQGFRDALELSLGDQPVEGFGGATERHPGALVVAKPVQQVELRPPLSRRWRRSGLIQDVRDLVAERRARHSNPEANLGGSRRRAGEGARQRERERAQKQN